MDAPEVKLPVVEKSMDDIWAEADKAFRKICGKSLLEGGVRSWDDAQRAIEGASRPSYGKKEEEEEVSWDGRAKDWGLQTLNFLKKLVGVASQASGFMPVPEAASNIASSALCFVFEIPTKIKAYNDAVDQVFSEVSFALYQFRIQKSIDNIDPSLKAQIERVIVCVVKLCAHVVNYRQGSKSHRYLQKFKSVFGDDSGLADAMSAFKRAVKQKHNLEGTITLAIAMETQKGMVEIQKGVKSLNEHDERTDTLIKIRNALDVPLTVILDANTTQTCMDISKKCLEGTCDWIWTHGAYKAWISPENKGKDGDISHVLLLSGPPSSGKTSATAQITRHLEDQPGRTYVAHYFFTTSASTKKSAYEDSTVQSALKYMAFQIARVDNTVRKALGKACDGGFQSDTNLDELWRKLNIGTAKSGDTYYLVFDGLENLLEKEAKKLLSFVVGETLAKSSSGRVRVLVSGTNNVFKAAELNLPLRKPLRIRMEKHNKPDMRLFIEHQLNAKSVLQHTQRNSDQETARDMIIKKLPKKAEGSYSRLQFGLDDVLDLLRTRKKLKELDSILNQPMNQHEEKAIENLERSLTVEEIKELNELMIWVLFSRESTMDLAQLEAAMSVKVLFSDRESLAPLEYIINTNYSAVLGIEDNYVYVQDGVEDYLKKAKNASGKPSYSQEKPTVSMTISINNVNPGVCNEIFWDLAHTANREKFSLDYDPASNNPPATIAVDEFEAQHTIVMRALAYLGKEPREQTEKIGDYLIYWLPHHLHHLRQLDSQELSRSLTPDQKLEIGRHLYEVFKDLKIFRSHKAVFERNWWDADDMDHVQDWLEDTTVVEMLPEEWRNVSPPRGYLRDWVRMVVEGLLREEERSWKVEHAYDWIQEFIKAVRSTMTCVFRLFHLGDNPSGGRLHQDYADIFPTKDNEHTQGATATGDNTWEVVSDWCKTYLELPDSELDSLWYERLAETALSRNHQDDAISLYQRAIGKENPSWLCHLGLGTAHFRRGDTCEAITEVERALEETGSPSAKPQPEGNDLMNLHLLLGEYAHTAADLSKAMVQYGIALDSKDPDQATKAQLGYLKTSRDAKEVKKLLQNILTNEDGNRRMTRLLKLIAREDDHVAIVSRMFRVANESPGRLKKLVGVMEEATTEPAPNDYRNETYEDDFFNEVIFRGVFLYYRGVAAYTYKVSSEGTESISEAVRLWKECRSKLSSIGGTSAAVARDAATTDLAKHYFQSMVDEGHLAYDEELAELAYSSKEANGFRGALYALHGDKEQSKKILLPRIRYALQILSDYTPDNDQLGYEIIYETLMQHRDFANAAVASSLSGSQDLVTDALCFEPENDPDEDERAISATCTHLAEEIIRHVKSEVTDSSQQVERIKVATDYIASRLPPSADGIGDTEAMGSVHHGEGGWTVSHMTAAVKRLQERLSKLQRTHSAGVNTDELVGWICNGRGSDGTRCNRVTDFETQFYHCIYCTERDFCGSCFERLRDPRTSAEITACSSKHRWFKVPLLGSDTMAGPRAQRVRVPTRVKAVQDDERVLEADYGKDGGRDNTVQSSTWIELLAKEWGVDIFGN